MLIGSTRRVHAVPLYININIAVERCVWRLDLKPGSS